ncbi:MAG TPA: hypothetical protein VE173_01580 [Longimicrobiales bacterium]|nr:hypothetical protein [Longimicrobiales bacterium]
MNVVVQTDSRPEAMADVPGVCELPLTRAVVQYRDVHEMDPVGGRIQDIGLALVLEGRFASAAEAMDLGSADLKVLDLSAELVVLDWVYEPTLEHAHALVRSAARTGDRAALSRFCAQMGLRVLERVGYGPLTRPILVRVGFRDICRDLDLHEGTSVRIVVGGGRMIRAHMDYDGNALVLRTSSRSADPALDGAILAAFPSADLRRLMPAADGGHGGYQVRFPLPLDFPEVKDQLGEIRSGLTRLVSRFEPDRFRAVNRLVTTFGRRETLARLHFREPRFRYPRVAAPSEASTVH